MNEATVRRSVSDGTDALRVASMARAGVDFSVGAYLAKQRRLRGLSIEDVESATRIPRRALGRLEAGAFDGKSDAFVRGFVRTVAGAIGADPDDTVVRLCEAAAPMPQARSRRRRSWRTLLLASSAALGLAACGAGAMAIAGRSGEAAPEVAAAPDAAAAASGYPASVLVRRDPVRLLAKQVRESTPGSFARPRALALPPEMLVAPAAEVALDSIFGRGAVALPPLAPAVVAHAAPAAVSAGPGRSGAEANAPQASASSR